MTTLPLRILFAAIMLLIVLIGAACASAQPLSTAAQSPAVPLAPNLTPTGTITLSLATVFTVTLTPQLTRLVTRDVINIRSGPGVNYPNVGTFAAGAEAVILARSEDGLWWQVACPLGATGDSCWVVADPLFSQAANAALVPVALAPPTPTVTPTPSATPCVPNAPDGWTSYSVQPGDTLFALALQTGMTTEQLAAVNCLETDLLLVGRTLLLPTAAFVPDSSAPLPTRRVVSAGPLSGAGGGAGGGGEPSPPQRLGTTISEESALADGIIALIDHSEPAGELCPISDANLGLHIGLNPNELHDTFTIAQAFVICPIGFANIEEVVVSIASSISPTSQLSATFWYDRVMGGQRWVILPDAKPAPYEVTATLATDVITNSLLVTEAHTPTVAVITKQVASDELVRVAVAGMGPADQLYLYYFDEEAQQCRIFWQLPLPSLDSSGAGIVEFHLLPDDPIAPYYCVGAGVHTDEASLEVTGTFDFKVFEVVTR